MEMTPRELAIRIARLLDSKKANELSVVEVSDVTVLADFFVICTGTSSTQVRSFSDEVEFKLKTEDGITPSHIEGHSTKSWIAMDYGSVIVHIFDPEARTYYDLERLWSDGKKLDKSEYIEQQ